MRLFNLAFLFVAAALVAGQEPVDNVDEYDDERENTSFNGQIVPPIPLLTPSNWNDAMKESKYLVVKHYRYVSHRGIFIFLFTRAGDFDQCSPHP